MTRRPRFHLTAPSGWLNDPHGITFHDGAYHLFHQYVPGSTDWSPGCHWGHATSPDLLTWTHHGVALRPATDEVGAWTGCVVTHHGTATAFYTSVTDEDLALGRVRVATPQDATWSTWTPGPVVVRPPADVDLVAFRDPFVLAEGTGWRMVVAGAHRDGRAMVLSWLSEDLEQWTPAGPVLSRPSSERAPIWTGSLWECPQVLEVDGHWIMLGSVWHEDVLHHAAYAIGERDSFRGGRLVPSDWARLTFGDSYYAPSCFRDAEDRACLMLWMRGVDDPQRGSAGAMSIPYVLSVRDGRLRASPHPNLVDAHQGPVTSGDRVSALDLRWRPRRDGDRLTLESSSGPPTRVVARDGVVSLEAASGVVDGWSMPWTGGELRVVADGPVLEVSTRDGVLGGAVGPVVAWSGSGDVEARRVGPGTPGA